jgi:hypothetical protein
MPFVVTRTALFFYCAGVLNKQPLLLHLINMDALYKQPLFCTRVLLWLFLPTALDERWISV